MDIPEPVPSSLEARDRSRRKLVKRVVLALVIVAVAGAVGWFFYDKVGSKPAGVPPDTTKAVRDTFMTTKTGNKKW
jgi:hypothetical protein